MDARPARWYSVDAPSRLLQAERGTWDGGYMEVGEWREDAAIDGLGGAAASIGAKPGTNAGRGLRCRTMNHRPHRRDTSRHPIDKSRTSANVREQSQADPRRTLSGEKAPMLRPDQSAARCVERDKPKPAPCTGPVPYQRCTSARQAAGTRRPAWEKKKKLRPSSAVVGASHNVKPPPSALAGLVWASATAVVGDGCWIRRLAGARQARPCASLGRMASLSSILLHKPGDRWTQETGRLGPLLTNREARKRTLKCRGPPLMLPHVSGQGGVWRRR